jgi:hypothetical protein
LRRTTQDRKHTTRYVVHFHGFFFFACEYLKWAWFHLLSALANSIDIAACSTGFSLFLPVYHWSKCGLEGKKVGRPWPPRPLRFLRHCIIVFQLQVMSGKPFCCTTFPSTMYGILPDKYYIHTLLLSKAIRVLLEESISDERMHLAEKLVKKIYRLLGYCYGMFLRLLIICSCCCIMLHMA